MLLSHKNHEKNVKKMETLSGNVYIINNSYKFV